MRRMRAALSRRQISSLREDVPAQNHCRVGDPFWEVLMNRDLRSPFLCFVAYLAIRGGSVRHAREHFRVNRFTFGDWLAAARERLQSE